jgi:hypothetical protein
VVDFLEGIFVNPHQQSKARSELRTYKMKPSQDFKDFEARFTQLANEAELPLEQWKDELHDALTGSLPVHLEVHRNDPTVSFFDYCKIARQIASSLQRTAAEASQRRAAREPPAKPSSRSVLQPLVVPSPAPARRAATEPRDDACYKCGKPGHFSRDCPRARAKSKAVRAAASDNDEPGPERELTTDGELFEED